MSEPVRRGLRLQGFACDTDPAIAAAAPWLRFTPAVSTLCIVTGTVLRSPAILWAFAAVATVGALGWNAFDRTPAVLGNPTVVAGVGVTHLRYPVRKA